MKLTTKWNKEKLEIERAKLEVKKRIITEKARRDQQLTLKHKAEAMNLEEQRQQEKVMLAQLKKEIETERKVAIQNK